jgi:hypothetical protein
MKQIKLMADYQCFPLWGVSKEDIGNINPRDLPISNELKNSLLAWGKAYDHTLNMDDPMSSGFPTAEDELQFKEIGRALAARLSSELGDDYQVIVKV